MYKPGCWKMVCDVCGFEYLNTQMHERWDGAWVCEPDFETRHPQEFGRSIVDLQTVPYSRPEVAEIFIDVPYITDVVPGEPEMPELPIGPSAAIAGAAIAGYAISGALS
jgi:hypothetical protein